MSKIMRQGFFIQIFAIAIVSLSGLLSISIMTKNIDEEQLAIILKFFFLFSLHSIFDGLRASATYNIRNRICSLNEYLKKSRMLGVVSTLIITSISVLLGFTDSIYSTLIICSSFIFYMQSSVCWAGLDSKMKLGMPQLIRSIAMATLYFVITMLSLNDIKLDYIIYTFPILWMFCYFVSRLLVIDLVKDNYFTGKNSGSLDKTSLLFTLSASSINIIDRIVLGSLSSNNSYSIYAAQYEYGYRMNLLGGNTGTLLYPYLLKNNDEKAHGLCFDFVSFIIFVLLFFLYVISINREQFYSLFLKFEFLDYYYVLYAVILSVVINTLGHIYIPLQRSLGDFKTSLYCYFFTVVFCFPISIYLIWQHGVMGAAFSVILVRLGDVLAFICSLWRVRARESLNELCSIFAILALAGYGFYRCIIGSDFENVVLGAVIISLINVIFRSLKRKNENF
ncbi:hypothetical protein [Photobacterium swingsii]|uniref:hypothetical protein n=1 Tax=Photobacterium swingsii TaxID=680026 RepID=UPI0040678B19